MTTQVTPIRKELQTTTTKSSQSFDLISDGHGARPHMEISTKNANADVFLLEIEEPHKSTGKTLSLEELDDVLSAQSPTYKESMREAFKWSGKRFYSEEISLKSIRLGCGFSQSELAEAVGTSQAQIAKIESGKTEPRITTVSRLAEALGVKPGELFEIIEAGLR